MHVHATIKQVWTSGLRSVLLSGVFAYGLVAGFGQNSFATEYGQRIHSFNVPAGSGADAIEIIGKQTGLQFLFKSRVLSGVETKALSGEFSHVQGLKALLEGSDVRAEFVASDIVVLRLKPKTLPKAVRKNIRKPEPPKKLPQDVPEPTLVNDTVIVTARRRLERLHDHPGNVASFNREKLEAGRVNGVEGVVYRTANALVEDRPGADMNVFIRGAGTATNGSGTRTDSAIGLYYDGIYTYLAGSRIPLLFYDMERIEILKGPQGGLYGRNTVGGAIVAQSARPHDQFSAGLRAEFGEYSSGLLEGHVNMPINEALFVRASGYFQDRDSYYTNIDLNKTERGSRTFAGRLRARYQPTENLDAQFTYEKTDEDKGPVLGVPITDNLQHISFATTDGFLKRNVERLNTNITWRGIDGVELQLIAGTANTKSNTVFDFNNLIRNEITGEFQIGEQDSTLSAKQTSVDVFVKSTGHGNLQWLVGGSYFEDRQLISAQILQGFPSAGVNLMRQHSQIGLHMASAFIDMSYDVSERFAINTSLRFSDEKRFREIPETSSLPVGSVTTDVTADIGYSELSPAVSFSYDVNDDFMAYAKVTTGYQSGGINARSDVDVFPAFGPSTAINYEMGFHSEWFNRRMLLNAALFRLDQNNFQYQSDNMFDAFVNAGTARTNGFELDVSGRVAPWLSVEAHYGYLDARTTDVPNSTFGDISGFRKLGIPRHSAAFGTDIHMPIQMPVFGGSADFTLNANYTLVLDRFLSDFVVQLDDYSQFDVKFGLEFENSTRIYAYAENLFDDMHIITPVSRQAVEISAPRRIGLGISKKF